MRDDEEELIGELVAANPCPPAKGRIRPPRLRSLGDARRELAKVYAEMRRGVLPSADGSRMAFVLGAVAKIIQMEQIEGRLSALEATVEAGKHGSKGPN